MPQADFETIQIERFVFHVLQRVDGQFQTTYLPPITLPPGPKALFERIFGRHASATKFSFASGSAIDGAEAPEAPVKTACAAILRDNNLFAQQAQLLAQDFFRHHRGSASPGIFVVSQFRAGAQGERSLVGLLKYDDESVITWGIDNGEPTFAEVAHALADNSNSIMKIAIIDPAETDGWNVAARDRQANPGQIAGYFRDYLQVEELVSPEKATKDVVQSTRNWAGRFEGAEGLIDRAEYQNRAVDFFRTQPAFTLASFLDYVVGPAADPQKTQARNSLGAHLNELGLVHDFPSRPTGLRKEQKRQVYRTAQQVEIIMPNGPVAGNVTLSNRGDEFKELRILSREITLL